MNVYVLLSLVLNSLFLSALLYLYLSRKKAIQNFLNSQGKLTATESNLLLLQDRLKQLDIKKNSAAKFSSQASTAVVSGELIELRKEVASLKSEVKKAKEEVRQKDKDLKEVEHVFSQKQHVILEENKSLLAQLKDYDKRLVEIQVSQKNLVSANALQEKQAELKCLKTEYENLKANHADIQRKYNKLSQEKNKEQKDKAIDINTLEIWKQRAFSGKKMYQLMRQMRELSDNKVSTYQEGLLALCEWIFVQKDVRPPIVNSGENKSDIYFAYAWNLLLSESVKFVDSTKITFQENISPSV